MERIGGDHKKSGALFEARVGRQRPKFAGLPLDEELCSELKVRLANVREAETSGIAKLLRQRAGYASIVSTRQPTSR